MSESRVRKRSRLGVILFVIFVLALVMGPGPGIYLVNPVPGEPATRVLGMPVVYLWAISWFFVQLAVVVVAYCTLWSRQDTRDAAPPAPRDT